MIRQRWEHLLFLHWTAKAAEIARLLPPGLEPDTFEGRAYVGVVPFTVPLNRLRWLPPLPFVSAFHEVNARTYVRGPGGLSGVWFFSLDASSSVVAQAAKASFHLPYRTAAIRFGIETPDAAGRRWISFASRRVASDPPDCAVRYGPGGVPQVAQYGTLEHFLIERYVLFAWTGERLLEGRVRHRSYPIQPAALDTWRERLLVSAGLPPTDGEPLAHYSAGVTVDILRPRPAPTASVSS